MALQQYATEQVLELRLHIPVGIPMSATIILSPAKAAETVCHEEQLRIWAHDHIVGSLAMGDWLRDDLSYDDQIELEACMMREIKSIVESAFDHPDDADAQDQFEREQRIWAAAAYRRKQSQSSLLWGFGSAALLIIALIALHGPNK